MIMQIKGSHQVTYSSTHICIVLITILIILTAIEQPFLDR